MERKCVYCQKKVNPEKPGVIPVMTTGRFTIRFQYGEEHEPILYGFGNSTTDDFRAFYYCNVDCLEKEFKNVLSRGRLYADSLKNSQRRTGK